MHPAQRARNKRRAKAREHSRIFNKLEALMSYKPRDENETSLVIETGGALIYELYRRGALA